MVDSNIDLEIRKKFINEDGSLNKTSHPKSYMYYDYVMQRFKDSESFAESIYRICRNIETRPTCPTCRGKLKYSNFKFSKHCSHKCSAIDSSTREKCKLSCMKKYGVDNPAKAEEIKEKSKLTCLKKYGVEYTAQTDLVKEKRKDTWYKKYGCYEYLTSEDCKLKTKMWLNGYDNVFQLPEIKEKIKTSILNRYNGKYYVESDEYKESIFKKYGVDSIFKCSEIRDKSKMTMLSKYGVLNYSQSPEWNNKVSRSSLEKYGVNYPFQADSVKSKIKNTMSEKYGVEYYSQTKEFIDKSKQTMFEKYGDYFVNTPIHKNHMLEISDSIKQKYKDTCIKKYGVDNFSKTPEFKKKIYQTKKKNKSFNCSKPEDVCYTIIKEKYPDVIRQYKDIRYPYVCDFYLPDLDLFIEFNGHWTHGKHPFSNTDIADIKLLEEWKSKCSKFYDNAIKTWTERDVKKRLTAHNNNLNYIELWSLDDAKEFIRQH